jgi:thymidine phosphorylase
MLPQEIIRKKRQGHELSAQEIQSFVQGITSEEVGEAQMAAFAMAVFLQGMNIEETATLTAAMRDSGEILQWDLPGPVLDKHSTGGVGDMVSLMLGPIVAACGAYVPMISGRGLGHSGGTVDKLESIPGYNTQPDNALFRRCVSEVGVCIIGQTANLAPADKKLYAIRDITATVESIPLITASILSKKLAEDLSALVMDIKVGNGAFMTSLEQAETLSQNMVQVAAELGVKTHVLITDMDSPLAYNVGNALEIREVIAFLNNDRCHPDLLEVTLELAAEMLLLGGLSSDHEAALTRARQALNDGSAGERFQSMVSLLGGPPDLMLNPDKYLPRAPFIQSVPSPQCGFIAGYNTTEIGLSVVQLGGGRSHCGETINHSVGLSELLPIGSEVQAGSPLVTIHAKDAEQWQIAAEQFLHSTHFSAEAVKTRPRLQQRISLVPPIPKAIGVATRQQRNSSP